MIYILAGVCFLLAITSIVCFVELHNLKKKISQIKKQQIDLAQSHYSFVDALGYDLTISGEPRKKQN